jgi:hypothetical protein
MIETRNHRIAGRLWASLRLPGGPPLLERRSHNLVVRSGAELIAGLLSGRTALPVNAMAVGADPDPSGPPYAATALALTDEEGAPAFEGAAPVTTVSLSPEGFSVETLADELRVVLAIRGVVPPGVATGLIGEAALGVLAPATPGAPPALAGIYNRVVFEPIRKESPHELALYWEISFPYGP